MIYPRVFLVPQKGASLLTWVFCVPQLLLEEQKELKSTGHCFSWYSSCCLDNDSPPCQDEKHDLTQHFLWAPGSATIHAGWSQGNQGQLKRGGKKDPELLATANSGPGQICLSYHTERMKNLLWPKKSPCAFSHSSSSSHCLRPSCHSPGRTPARQGRTSQGQQGSDFCRGTELQVEPGWG